MTLTTDPGPDPLGPGGALIRDVLERLDSDAPRLVYADWLSENGQEERGEFIRLQVELAATAFRLCQKHCYGCTDREPPKQHHAKHSWDAKLCANGRRRIELRRRERELLDAHAQQWLPYLHAPDGRSVIRDSQFRRGFLHTVRVSAAEWQRETTLRIDDEYPRLPGVSVHTQTIGQSILAANPVQRVELMDGGLIEIMLCNGLKPPWVLQYHSRFIPGESGRPGYWDVASNMRFDSRAVLIEQMPATLRAWGVGLTVTVGAVHAVPDDWPSRQFAQT